MSEARFLVGDVFDRMADIPDGSVDLIVTSPPFLALRSYLPADHPDKDREIGSEPTPAAFLSTLLALTREWRRILAPHGSLCVELGDTYAGSGGAGGDYDEGGLRDGQPKFKANPGRSVGEHKLRRPGYKGSISVRVSRDELPKKGDGWPLAKSLCGIPDAYQLSLAYGWNMLNPAELCERWRVRNKIVWHRPNPPVGALGDKVRPSTSYITVACVSDKRWFDLDSERTAHQTADALTRPRAVYDTDQRGPGGDQTSGNGSGSNPAGAPPLDCWTIPTAPYAGAHYATFPPALPRKLINLMCPRQVCTICGEPRRRITETVNALGEAAGRRSWRHDTEGKHTGDITVKISSAPTADVRTLGWTDCGHDNWCRGIVLDPFAGSGTTLQAASELGRDSIGIDLDHRNLDLARQRLGMFLQEDEVVA